MEIRKIKNREQWEEFLKDCSPKTFLQSWNWGEFQKKLGEKVWRLAIFENQEILAQAQVIKVKAKRGTFLFLPHGPIIKKQKAKSKKQNYNFKVKILKTLLDELKNLAKKEKAVFLRIAPILERNQENERIFKNLGFKEAPLHIHPETTWQLDITLPEKDLLMEMRKTTRYLIRQALKNPELKIIKSKNLKDLKIFNEIYQQTAKRQRFVPFSFEYLKKEFETFLKDDQILLFLAKYQQEFLAGAMIIFWQKGGFYHQGASIKKYPKIPASYLIQWEAILEAKKRGCQTYNFWGIADINQKSEIKNQRFRKDNQGVFTN